MQVRTATPEDAEAIRAIYDHHVRHHVGSSEEQPPDVTEIRARMYHGHWVVVADGPVLGTPTTSSTGHVPRTGSPSRTASTSTMNRWAAASGYACWTRSSGTPATPVSGRRWPRSGARTTPRRSRCTSVAGSTGPACWPESGQTRAHLRRRAAAATRCDQVEVRLAQRGEHLLTSRVHHRPQGRGPRPGPRRGWRGRPRRNRGSRAAPRRSPELHRGERRPDPRRRRLSAP